MLPKTVIALAALGFGSVDLPQPEEARRHPRGYGADCLAGRAAQELGPAHECREEALHPPGRSLCRASRPYGPRDRPGHRRGREDGQARQHADHLYQRRQRRFGRRQADRHAQRDPCLQRHQPDCRRADQVVRRLGDGPTYPHMAVPWAWAFDTPFRWTKQVATYFGGTRQGVAMSWPAVIKDKGGIRNRFADVIDIVPTLLYATGAAGRRLGRHAPRAPPAEHDGRPAGIRLFRPPPDRHSAVQPWQIECRSLLGPVAADRAGPDWRWRSRLQRSRCACRRCQSREARPSGSITPTGFPAPRPAC